MYGDETWAMTGREEDILKDAAEECSGIWLE